MKSICRAVVAQWTKRLTRNGQTQVRNREAEFLILYNLAVKPVIANFRCLTQFS